MSSKKQEARSRKFPAGATAWAVGAVLLAGGMVWGQASMPAGHPALGGGAMSMPAGHPGMGGGAASMPAGHPGMGGAVTTGALRVLISQGTKDGTAIGQDPVTVELYALNKVIKTYQTKMDAKGMVELRDLPMEVEFQPVVTVMHGGVPQRLVSEVAITKHRPAIELEMKVYDVTETRPDWTIGMRYAVMRPEGLGKVTSLRVEETIGGYNPTDKAWVGAENGAKEREAFSVTLPAGATDLVLGPGMIEAGAKLVDGKLVRPGPMLADSTVYVFAYSVPVKEGRATVSFVAPTKTTLFAVYPPAGAKVVKAEGIAPSTVKGNRGELVGKVLKAGSVATLELSDISYAEPAQEVKPEGK